MLKKLLIGSAFGLLLSAGTLCRSGCHDQASGGYCRNEASAPQVQTMFGLPGYHNWDGHAYVWVPGRWEVPPRPTRGG
jgi:hypothetical protein